MVQWRRREAVLQDQQQKTKMNAAEAELHFFQTMKIKDMGLSEIVDKTRLSQRSTAMPLRGFAP